MFGDRRIEIDDIAVSDRKDTRVQIREVCLNSRVHLLIGDEFFLEEFADRWGFGHDKSNHGSTVVAISAAMGG